MKKRAFSGVVASMLRLAAMLLFVTTACVFAQQKPTPAPMPPPSNGNEIMPPFSLVWHEPSERLEAKIAAAKLEIEGRRKIGDRWALVVTGFKKKDAKPPELKRVLFFFAGGQVARGKSGDEIAGGQLVEVELQYQETGWTEPQYGQCLSEKRQMLERLYGQGQQLIRKSMPAPDGDATQTLVGWKWNKNNTSVELVYFNLTSNTGGNIFHTLSLHYKRS